MMYPDEKISFHCNVINRDVTIVTKFFQYPYMKKVDKKICSGWDICTNRQDCKYGKM